MAGAIAGTAILDCLYNSNKINTITLTINNLCGLNCQHCYLQYNSNSNFIEDKTIDSIFKSDFDHLAVVGMEPMVNKKSINILKRLVELSVQHSKTISIITNGMNLLKMPKDYVPLFKYFDISFDGGLNTYSMFRNGNIDMIFEGIAYLKENNVRQINSLHTIYKENSYFIDDLLSIQNRYDFSKIMFSPYLQTNNDGFNSVHSLQLVDILKLLSESSSFLNSHPAFLLVDTHHLSQDDITSSEFSRLLNKFKLKDKVKLIANDPIEYGIIRVTFDDLVLSPYASLHTNKYRGCNIKASRSDINQAFLEIKERELAYEN